MKRSSQIDITCLNCSMIFKVKKHRKDTAKYCSRSCGALYVRIRHTSKCEICSKNFEHISSRANKAKYCSRSCYYKARINKGTAKFKCKHCLKEFLDSPSKKRIYCSKKCVNKANVSTWNAAFSTVRKSLLCRGMLEKCELCGFDKCKKIIGVHHKDGNRYNNDLSNLMVLCPNCHSLEHQKHIPHGS